MTNESSRSPGAIAAFEADGPAGAAGRVIAGFQPVRSRWTWQPRLPELWLREHEGRQFREMIIEQMNENSRVEDERVPKETS